MDLAYVTDHAEASIVLVDESLLPVAEALVEQGVGVKTWVVMTDKPLSEISTTLPGVVHWEDALTAAESTFDWPMIDETSAYSACYTTGTTGRPKGVYYSHRGIYLHTLAEAAQLKMGDDDTVMVITPMFHGQGWGLPQSAIYSAAKVVLPGRYTAEDTSVLVDAMISESVTVANGAPAIFEPMLDYIRTLKTRPDFSRARLLSGATEPSLTLMRGFHDLTGADIIHAYGATETTPLVTVNAGLKHTLRDVLSEKEKWDLKRARVCWSTGSTSRSSDRTEPNYPTTVSPRARCSCAARGSSSATTRWKTKAARSPMGGGAAAMPARSAPTATSS
ncbi:Medium-chain-fatty-acid--CoA ligase [Dietzia timorensis]|uniref:Medium-chain-fatty-acid--CoA ligase n=1 Tax=Dietzia timorensis TaxID=499555 RepID=A0A173LK88_9ACTN|nr:Medium-chain-fatty-acid--CoA ligase [Dietzia timorensis]